MTFSKLAIPPKSVHIDIDKSVIIKVSDISAVIKNFNWSYNKKNFPRVNDSGTADAICENAEGYVEFVFVIAEGKASIEITKIHFKLGQLNVKVFNVGASWLYNLVLGLFSKSITTAVEDKLEGLLKKHLSELTEKINSITQNLLL